MLLQRGLTFKSLMTAIMILKRTVDCLAEKGIPAELVNRRHVGDIYHNYNSDESISCAEANNLTLLVDETQCVDQQLLLNGRGGYYLSNIT
jgi:hypothetical protein